MNFYEFWNVFEMYCIDFYVFIITMYCIDFAMNFDWFRNFESFN